MKLAAWMASGGPTFGVVGEGGEVFDLVQRSSGKLADLKDLIASAGLAEARSLATGRPDGTLAGVTLLPPVPRQAKIICVGINYPERNAEYRDGAEPAKYPSLFVRFPSSLVGHGVPIVRPSESNQLDYEGEIVLVIGKAGRRIAESAAHDHIFGLTLMNDGSVRDWVRHGKFNVTPGKNFERSGSLGPWIVTRDAVGRLDDLALLTRVNGEERQRGNTGTLTFPVARLIAYISKFTTLEPGDLIATGTPPGAGGRFDPPRWLQAGDVVEVECPGIGTLRNGVINEPE